MSISILPMPPEIGVGITSFQPLPENLVLGMKQDKVGMYYNYHFTENNFNFPLLKENDQKQIVIDGFSPNLNKTLHIGHMRNIVLANSLVKILKAKPVALLGASLGVLKDAKSNYDKLCKEFGYYPEIYYDVLMPVDVLEKESLKDIPGGIENDEKTKDFRGTTIWEGPKGPVIVKKSNGNKTYAYWDLVFAKIVAPDYYITGIEQKEHFESLGLDKKHLPMGLVLGIDGKKLKSRTGDALSFNDALEMVVSNLKETKNSVNKHQLAWNVLIWNFLSVSRGKNIKFNPEEWTKTDSGGMYISYTFARAKSALIKTDKDHSVECIYEKKDIHLLGNSSYFEYHYDQCKKKLDPSSLAHFAFELAKKINEAYESEKLIGGRDGFILAFKRATETLKTTMGLLGMFQQESV